MSVARRANLIFSVFFLLALTVAGSVYFLARGAANEVTRYRDQTEALDTTMWSLRSDFYYYDDQMNMYVAVLLNSTDQKDLAETTYQQAVAARAQLAADLDRADHLTTDPALRTLLARLRQDYVGYNGFADQTRAAAQAGDLHRAAYLATVGNLVPSNDMMPTLEKASAIVAKLAATAMKQVAGRQSTLEQVSTVFGGLVVVLLVILRIGLQVFVLGPVAAVRGTMTAIATGQASRAERVAAVRDDEFGHVAVAFNMMLDALAGQDAALGVQQAERETEIKERAERTRAAERSVRERAQTTVDENATAVVTELTKVMSEVDAVRSSATVIDDRVAEATTRTREVVEQAHNADRVVGALGESLRRVGGMAALIAGVADQTKLLALNATIEAARAGTAGKGFGVVASEVKELATATAHSTSEISSTIGALEGNAAAMTGAIAGMAEGITGVNEATSVLTEVASQQRATVENLERRVTEAITRIEAMSNLDERLERRRHQRIEISGPIDLSGGGQSHHATLIDLSEGGMRCRLDTEANLAGVTLTVNLNLGGERRNLQGKALPRPDGMNPHELSIEFGSPSESDRAWLHSHLPLD